MEHSVLGQRAEPQMCWSLHECACLCSLLHPKQLWLLNSSGCLLAALAQYSQVEKGRTRVTVTCLPSNMRAIQCVWG